MGNGLQTSSYPSRVDLSPMDGETLGAVKLAIEHRPEIQGSISSGTRLGGGR